jgi:hypothetical protein
MNEDLKQRAAIETGVLAWAPVAEGVEEKLLEEAPGRRTALLRLAPGARVEATDVLVLEGELAGVPAGTFAHGAGPLVAVQPTVAFVKQRPALRPTWVVDTRTTSFVDGQTPGLQRMPLYEDEHGDVVLLRFTPGIVIASHAHADGEELFVLDGELIDEHGHYTRHWWVRQPPGSVHAITSTGCTTLTFAHHLR